MQHNGSRSVRCTYAERASRALVDEYRPGCSAMRSKLHTISAFKFSMLCGSSSDSVQHQEATNVLREGKNDLNIFLGRSELRSTRMTHAPRTSISSGHWRQYQLTLEGKCCLVHGECLEDLCLSLSPGTFHLLSFLCTAKIEKWVGTPFDYTI